MKLGFLASNSGSSLRAIVAAIEAGALAAEARLVVSNKSGSPALVFAAEHGISTRIIPTVRSPERADERLEQAMIAAEVDLVILSGYLRKLGPRTLARYRNRVLNIHPALLPRHGGPGMYGRRVHEAALAAGDTISGATVHLVDEDYDHGEAIARVEVPVLPDDGPADLERRVMTAEPKLFVETLQRLVAGTLQLPEVS
jgi:phosphoribosylglycinamide formyltransferase-1